MLSGRVCTLAEPLLALGLLTAGAPHRGKQSARARGARLGSAWLGPAQAPRPLSVASYTFVDPLRNTIERILWRLRAAISKPP